MTEHSEQSVIFDILESGNDYKIAHATLNAPKSLNALTLEMAEALAFQLRQWQEDDTIACVILRGCGDRAFCAGGDVVALRNSALAGDDTAAEKFFEQEYRLDYLIHTYTKPIIVWGHGVVMGGGMGLLSGASHRVVTAETRLAMPEITIGFYPDVGGSWFLNKAPGRTGLFLALTGAAMNAGDALYLGLADRFLKHEQYGQVVDGLKATCWTSPDQHFGQVSHILRDLEKQAGDSASVVRAHYDLIQAMTGKDCVEDIVNDIVSYNGDDQWLCGAAKTLTNGCPASIGIIDEQLRRSLHMSLREVFQMELTLSVNCVKNGNFAEGVRALLVDKDRQPAFDPARLEDVTPEYVEKHFLSPWEDGKHPLADL